MIGVNIKALLQMQNGAIKNEIGESVPAWKTVHEITGFLDLSSGDSKRTVYNSKVQESTHIFICDYFAMSEQITAENSRMLIAGLEYDIMLIDNPMNLNQHLEIYLKYTGGQ